MFLYFALANQKAFNIVLEFSKVSINFTLNDWLSLSYGLHIMILMLSMNYALRADALAFAIEAEIENLLL